MAITRRISSNSKSKRPSISLPSSSMVTRSSARRQSGGPGLAIVIDNQDDISAPKRSREYEDDYDTNYNKTPTATKRARVMEFPPKGHMTRSNRLTRCQRIPKEEDHETLKIRIRREESKYESDSESLDSDSDSVSDSDDSDYFSYDELPNFQYESKYTDGADDQDKENPFDMDALTTDIPLVDLNVNDDEEAHVSFENFVDNKNVVLEKRWPIEQDDSSTFSILVKNRVAVSASNPNASSTTSSTTPSSSSTYIPSLSKESSIEEFLDYDSAAGLTDDEGDSDSSASPSTSSPTSPSLPSTSLSRPLWTDKYHNIPICGYRDRNRNDLIPTIVTPNQSKLIAALSTISTPKSSLDGAYYQQAVIAAVGLNKRSLWSGKARQMVSGDDRPFC